MKDDAVDDVVVEQMPVPTWEGDLLLARAEQVDLLVLPRTVRDERGEYRAADVPGVKALREAGVSVRLGASCTRADIRQRVRC